MEQDGSFAVTNRCVDALQSVLPARLCDELGLTEFSMAGASEIAHVVCEYQAIQRGLEAIGDDEEAAREELQAKQTAIAMQLVQMPAASGPELAQKALVLLDWVNAEDISGELTVSLCKDALRTFLPRAARRSVQDP